MRKRITGTPEAGSEAKGVAVDGDVATASEEATASELQTVRGQLEDCEEKASLLEAQMQEAKLVLQALSKERDEWAAKAKVAVEQYLRAREDFDGYRKRIERDLENRVTREKADFIVTLLETMDNFDRALGMPVPGQAEGFMKGMAMIRRQLTDALQKEGVEPIPSPAGQPMDPNLHEAVLAQEGGGDHGIVLEELLKGYLYKGLLLRATQVKVVR